MKTEKNITLELTANELFILEVALGWSRQSAENEQSIKEINQILDKLEQQK